MLGVAVLGAIFAASGSYVSPEAFMDGLTLAVWTGVAVLAAGSLVALLLPARNGAPRAVADPETARQPVAAEPVEA